MIVRGARLRPRCQCVINAGLGGGEREMEVRVS